MRVTTVICSFWVFWMILVGLAVSDLRFNEALSVLIPFSTILSLENLLAAAL